jgi:hypothetical protein
MTTFRRPIERSPQAFVSGYHARAVLDLGYVTGGVNPYRFRVGYRWVRVRVDFLLPVHPYAICEYYIAGIDNIHRLIGF